MAGYDLELNNKNTQDFNVVFHGPKESGRRTPPPFRFEGLSGLFVTLFVIRVNHCFDFPLLCGVLLPVAQCHFRCVGVFSNIRRRCVESTRDTARRLPLLFTVNWLFKQDFTS